MTKIAKNAFAFSQPECDKIGVFKGLPLPEDMNETRPSVCEDYTPSNPSNSYEEKHDLHNVSKEAVGAISAEIAPTDVKASFNVEDHKKTAPNLITKNNIKRNPGGAPKVPTRWRDLNVSDLLWFYASGIQELGEPVLFSLHFSNDVHAKMKASNTSARDYIAQRFRHRFGNVPLYFVVEITPSTEVLHIHGALARTTQSEADIDLGLRKVCGDKRKTSGKNELFFLNAKAAHSTPPDWNKNFHDMFGSFGWAQYCGKDIQATKRKLKIDGSLISRTMSLHRHAKRIFEECSAPVE